MNSINWDKLSEVFIYIKDKPLIFNSGIFLVLFLLFYSIYISLNNTPRIRIIYTTLFSIYFYYKSSGNYFVILLISTLIDFYLGKMIQNASSQSKKKLFLTLSLVSNLGILAYFKYTNFLIDNFNILTQSYIQFYDIFLPVGISFYTFQTLSYSIDIYRGNLKACDNIWDFAFFVSFFPQLVAGPIVRAADFIPQIREKIKVSKEDFNRALLLISAGLFKKAIISDYISINFVDRVFDNPLLYNSIDNLIAVYGYAIQIYCDFSGYSDIAIGLGLIMGFTLPINFDSPYKSTSITEFWRRWHISLSSWLKDYLYISLGGNRKGKIRTYLNLLITMLLGGLWHGPSWKFVVWGALHGSMLAIEKFIWSLGLKTNHPIMKFLGAIFTFHFVCFCWIFFRASNWDLAIQVINQISQLFYWGSLKNLISGIDFIQYWNTYKFVFSLIIAGYFFHLLPSKLELKINALFDKFPMPLKSAYIAFICWVIWQVSTSEVQPFIYFQF